MGDEDTISLPENLISRFSNTVVQIVLSPVVYLSNVTLCISLSLVIWFDTC